MIEICSMQKAGLCKVLSICGTKATLLSKEKKQGPRDKENPACSLSAPPAPNLLGSERSSSNQDHKEGDLLPQEGRPRHSEATGVTWGIKNC